MQMIKRILKEEKGLTLIELLAVIVILGIIAAIAVPSIGGLINSTEKKASLAIAKQFYEVARLYVTAEHGGDYTKDTTITYSELISKGYLENGLKATTRDTGDEFTLDVNESKIVFTLNNGKYEGNFTITLSEGTSSGAKTATFTQADIKDLKE